MAVSGFCLAPTVACLVEAVRHGGRRLAFHSTASLPVHSDALSDMPPSDMALHR